MMKGELQQMLSVLCQLQDVLDGAAMHHGGFEPDQADQTDQADEPSMEDVMSKDSAGPMDEGDALDRRLAAASKGSSPRDDNQD